FDERFAGQVQNSRAAQAQATDVKLAARLAAAQPGKFGSLALRGERRLAGFEARFELLDRKVFGRRQRDRLDAPSRVAGVDGLTFRRLPRAFHSVREALREQEPVLR